MIKAFSRHILRQVGYALLRLRASPSDFADERTLVIAPHPDDESFGCGGFIFHQRLTGRPVHILWLTDGSASHPNHPIITPNTLADMRRGEARAAAARLAVDSAEITFLGLPDGRLNHLTAAEQSSAETALVQIVNTFRPSLILLPCANDGSSEHESAFRLMQSALKRMHILPRILTFPVWAVWSPRLLLRLLFHRNRVHAFRFRGYGALKQHAFSAYASQLLPTPPWQSAVLPAGFTAAFASETEFFFATEPTERRSAATSPIRRLLHRIRFKLHGHAAGLGQPVPVTVLNNEYSSGAWNHFQQAAERPRYEALVQLVHRTHAKPRLLDVGCGTGQLAATIDNARLASYFGTDVSPIALQRAELLHRTNSSLGFARHDFETWTPTADSFDVIVFNESLGYAADPLRTAKRFYHALGPGGAIIVSLFRSGNHVEFWQRLAREFDFTHDSVVTNAKGQTWDLRVLQRHTAQ